MSPILYNTPDDEGTLMEWSAIHQKDHFAIMAEIQRKMSGTTVLVIPIDPVPLQLDILTWSMSHQYMHNEMNDVVGLAGFDLSSPNFMQREQLRVWIDYHAREHFNLWQQLSALPTGLPFQVPSTVRNQGAPPTPSS
jgi:hypothetical protein